MRLPPMEKRKSKEPYPMPDEQHAKSAIGFAKMHHPGSSIVGKIKAKARRKFPGMNIKMHGGAVHHRADRAKRKG